MIILTVYPSDKRMFTMETPVVPPRDSLLYFGGSIYRVIDVGFAITEDVKADYSMEASITVTKL